MMMTGILEQNDICNSRPSSLGWKSFQKGRSEDLRDDLKSKIGTKLNP